MRRALLAFPALLLTLPALAQDAPGTLTGTVDGNDVGLRVLNVPDEAGGRGSSWSDTEGRRQIAIVAEPSEAGMPEMTIEFALPDSGGTAASEAIVTYTDGDVILVSGPESTTITLDNATVTEDTLDVSGTVTATLIESSADGVPLTADGEATFEGAFDLTLIRSD